MAAGEVGMTEDGCGTDGITGGITDDEVTAGVAKLASGVGSVIVAG